MKKVLTNAVAIICLLLLGFLSSVFAYRVWVEKDGNKLVIAWRMPQRKTLMSLSG